MNIDFPFHFDGRGRTASTDDNAHIRDMIEQLLFTNMGERVNHPDFGGELLRMVFELNSPERATALEFKMRGAIQRWLGEIIELRSLEITSEDSSLRVLVQYVVRSTNEIQGAQFTRTV